MWVEKIRNGQYKYSERYTDPYTEKTKKVSVQLSSESRQAWNQAQRILNDKIESALEKKLNTNMRTEQLLDEWWAFHKKSLKPFSIRAYNSVLKYIKNNFDTDVLIVKADTKLFQRFFNKLEFSDEYNKKIRNVLQMAFEYAVNIDLLERNPLEKTKLKKQPKSLDDIALIKNKYLEKDEMKLLLDMFYSSFQSVRMGYLAEFMYLTGLRFGEAVSLTICNVDTVSKMLEVHGTLDYSHGYATAKKTMTKTNSSYREISLPDRAIEILETLIFENELKFGPQDKKSYIFVGKTGKPIQGNSFNTSLKHTNEKLGDKKISKNISSHIFRHSHISLLAELGIPIKTIMDRVGHSTEKTTLQIYTHVTKEQNQEVANRINSITL